MGVLPEASKKLLPSVYWVCNKEGVLGGGVGCLGGARFVGGLFRRDVI